MSMLLKRSLISLVCLGLLSACVEEEETEDTSTSTFVVYGMSSVEAGYQTFQQRALDYDDESVDADASTYVYKDREYELTTSVVFNSANSSETQEEDLDVTAITDINDIYTALSIEDVTIKVNSVNYTGDYILIQEKSSGSLYPVVNADGIPLYNTEVTDEIFWHSAHRHSNMADETRVYLNDSVNETLYIFDLEDDLFVYSETFSYVGNDFWIDENGDILTQDTSAKAQMSLYDRSSSETISETFATANLLPFLYSGDLYAARSGNSYIYDLEASTTDFSWDSDSDVFTTNDDDYAPSTNSARRGDYEMSASCTLYQFDNTNPYAVEITLINDFDADNGRLAVAGQDALFCVHADNSADSASPIILKYDIETEENMSFETSDGSLANAADYLTVMSDDEVMFSNGSLTEYYINVVYAIEETITVSEPSIVTLQTLED